MTRRMRRAELVVNGEAVELDRVSYRDELATEDRSSVRVPRPSGSAEIGPSLLGGRLAMALDCLETAAREMTRAGLDDLPEDERQGLWSALAPTDILLGKDQRLYAAHARELIGRHRAGARLESATDAEVLCVLSEASLRAPLTRDALAAAQRLFERCYGAVERERLFGELEREPWPGAVAEMIGEVRRKMGSMR